MGAAARAWKRDSVSLRKVKEVSSESEPAWCWGPMRSTRSVSASLLRPPCRLPQNFMRYLMSYTLGKYSCGSAGRHAHEMMSIYPLSKPPGLTRPHQRVQGCRLACALPSIMA